MDWIAAINGHLQTLGIFPELEAHELSDRANHVVMVDTQEVTVYRSPEGVYRLVSILPDTANCEDVYRQLTSNQTDIRAYLDSGLYRQDHDAMLSEDE